MDTSTFEVAEYRPVEAGLEALRMKYSDLAFDVRSTKGNAEARAARRELVSLRTGLEAKRKELKAPLLAQAALVDSEAKRITAEVLALEKPIDDQIKADEVRREAERVARERAEQERVARIQASIRAIAETALRAVGKPSGAIESEIDALEAFEVDASYDEFQPGAQAAKDAALAQLRTLHGAALANEQEAARLQAERIELARQQAESIRIARENAAVEQANRDRIEAERQAQERVERERRELQERVDRQAAADREAAAAREQAEREEHARQQAAIEAKNAAESARIEEEKQALARSIQAEAQRKAEEAERIESKRVHEERRETRRAEVEAASAPLDKHHGSFMTRRVLPAESPIEALTPMPEREEILFAITDRWGVSASTANRWLVQLWGAQA